MSNGRSFQKRHINKPENVYFMYQSIENVWVREKLSTMNYLLQLVILVILICTFIATSEAGK